MEEVKGKGMSACKHRSGYVELKRYLGEETEEA